MHATRYWQAPSFGKSSLMPDALCPPTYLYMAFPVERITRIPQNPAEILRNAWSSGNRMPFLDWLQTGLASADYDISEMKLHALVHYKADAKLVSHQNPPTQFGHCEARYKTVGKIQFEATYQPGRVPDVDALLRADQIVVETTKSANHLLATLMDCTVALYGSETPCKAWPALLRAAARGWAFIMIKARLGSQLKKFDVAGTTEDEKPDYLFRFAFMEEEYKLTDQATCPARITNLLVRMFLDAKVPLFENEEGNIRRLNSVTIGHLGYPDFQDENDNGFAERRKHWKSEVDLLVKHLFPLDYCVRIMLEPVFNLLSGVPKNTTGHPFDFLVDDLETKVRKDAEQGPEDPSYWDSMTQDERDAWADEALKKLDWEEQNGRAWEYKSDPPRRY